MGFGAIRYLYRRIADGLADLPLQISDTSLARIATHELAQDVVEAVGGA